MLVLLSTPVLYGQATKTVKPNLIFILIDDQGYGDLGCYGASDLETPHVDTIARDGIRFTDYYAAAPICSPSRAGLLTGCYPRRVGLATWVQRADSRIGLHANELTIAELLKSNGYATACVGKWHLGFHEPFLPQRQGFDEYFGLLHNLDPVETIHFKDQGGVPLLRGRRVVRRPADVNELTKVYTEEAIEFIGRHRDRPFFLYLAHTMLHWPYGVSDRFRGSSGLGEYEDAIHELDHYVGEIFAALKRFGIDRRTVVVYASDNGRRARQGATGQGTLQPLRGGKLSTFEGGIRVPCIAWGPGVGLRRGYESSAVVRAMDWYPTLATLAGVEVPPGRVIDGRDMGPLLIGESDHVPAPSEELSINASVPLRRPWHPPLEWREIITRREYNDAFFYHGSQGSLAAVRWGKWKLFLNPTLTLYDLEQDPAETTPVANPKIARKLRGMAVMFQEEMQIGTRPVGEAAKDL